VLYTVHFTAFCLGRGGAFFPEHGVFVSRFHAIYFFCEKRRLLAAVSRIVSRRSFLL